MEQRHGEGGDGLPPSPEQHERLRINGIVIPADGKQELRQQQLTSKDFESYQQLVDGFVQVVALEQPPARMYVNDEAKLRGLPVNQRATMLLWMHNRAFRYHDFIAGDAFLVGHTDNRGLDTNVSDEFVGMLFTARQFNVEVKLHGRPEWHELEVRVDHWINAYFLGLGWGVGMGDHQRHEVADIRVVPEL